MNTSRRISQIKVIFRPLPPTHINRKINATVLAQLVVYTYIHTYIYNRGILDKCTGWPVLLCLGIRYICTDSQTRLGFWSCFFIVRVQNIYRKRNLNVKRQCGFWKTICRYVSDRWWRFSCNDTGRWISVINWMTKNRRVLRFKKYFRSWYHIIGSFIDLCSGEGDIMRAD